MGHDDTAAHSAGRPGRLASSFERRNREVESNPNPIRQSHAASGRGVNDETICETPGTCSTRGSTPEKLSPQLAGPNCALTSPASLSTSAESRSPLTTLTPLLDPKAAIDYDMGYDQDGICLAELGSSRRESGAASVDSRSPTKSAVAKGAANRASSRSGSARRTQQNLYQQQPRRKNYHQDDLQHSYCASDDRKPTWMNDDDRDALLSHTDSFPGGSRHLMRAGSHPCRRGITTRPTMPADMMLRRQVSIRNFEAWPENRSEKKIFISLLICKLCILLALGLSGLFAFLHLKLIENWITSFLAWVKHFGFLSFTVFTTFYSISTAFFFPLEMLTLGSGYIFCSSFGFKVGFPVACLSCTIGHVCSSTLSFMISRHAFSRPLRLFLSKYKLYRAGMRAARDGGASFVFLCRLSPFLPFTISNYVFGCTDIEYPSFALGCLGAIPLIAVVVWVGSCVKDVKELVHRRHVEVSMTNAIITGVGLVCGALAVGYAVWLTRKKMQEVDNEEDVTFGPAASYVPFAADEHEADINTKNPAPPTMTLTMAV